MASKDAVIPVKKTSKLPALWQAYSTLYYKSKLKPLVEKAWTSYLKGVHEESANRVEDTEGEVEGGAGNQKKMKSRIEILNEVAQTEFKKETKEVKKEVEAYVKGLKKKKAESSEQDSEALLERYQRLVQIHCDRRRLAHWLTVTQWHQQDTTNGCCICECHP